MDQQQPIPAAAAATPPPPDGATATSADSAAASGGGAAAAAKPRPRPAGGGGGGIGVQRLAVVDALDSLLSFAAQCLVEGGRLVYWLPTTAEYVAEDVPSHPLLALVANSGQQLTTTLYRRLITMVKLAQPKRQPQGAAVAAEAAAGGATSPEASAGRASVHRRAPAHHNLSAKVFRQAQREEDRLLKRTRSGTPCAPATQLQVEPQQQQAEEEEAEAEEEAGGWGV
jgi:hypothetical protein